MRDQAHRRRRPRAHRLLAAGARLRIGRPVVIVALLVVSLAAGLATDQLVAARPGAQAIRPEAFQPVTVPGAATGVGPAATEAATPGAAGTPAPGAKRATAMRTRVPPAPPPDVVRFRPRAGQDGISPLAAVSVRFTVAMDRASTQRAFSASVSGTRLEGRYRWAEGDTVLVLTPAWAMPYGARVTLTVSSDARSAAGIPLPQDVSAMFVVAAKPAATPAPSPAPATSSTRSTSGWRWPLIGPITQYFGQALTKYGYHYGIDIDGRTGDPVQAARSGRVVVAGHYDDCGGLEVHIDHGDGLVSWYRHLSRIDVKVGASVAAGTVIGLVGETGCALGSHLHFAIRRGTTFVDPLRYLPPR